MFGLSRKPANDLILSSYVKGDDASVVAFINGLALDQEARLLRRKDEFWETVQRRHADDIAAHRFECTTWGTFVTLMGARIVRLDRGDAPVVERFAVSINAATTTSMILEEGRAPDQNGILSYMGLGYEEPTPSGHKTPLPRAPDLLHYAVGARPSYRQGEYIGSSDYRRDMYRTAKAQEGYGFPYYGPLGPRLRFADHHTHHWPRLAEDDVIEFVGATGFLYVPAGLGRTILDQITSTIGDNGKQFTTEAATP